MYPLPSEMPGTLGVPIHHYLHIASTAAGISCTSSEGTKGSGLCQAIYSQPCVARCSVAPAGKIDPRAAIAGQSDRRIPYQRAIVMAAPPIAHSVLTSCECENGENTGWLLHPGFGVICVRRENQDSSRGVHQVVHDGLPPKVLPL